MRAKMDKCSKCGTALHEFTTGRKTIGEELFCDNCYFEEAGKVFEDNPIGFRHPRPSAR